MEQKQKFWLIFFIISLVAFFASVYAYNDIRNQLVEELQLQNYTCTTNMFGFYRTCYPPGYFDVPGFQIDFEVNITND